MSQPTLGSRYHAVTGVKDLDDGETSALTSRFGAIHAGGVDSDPLPAQFSPRVNQFLNSMTGDARQRLLDSVRRQLTSENAIVLLRRNCEQPLIAHIVDPCERASVVPRMMLTDLHDCPIPREETLRAVFDLTPAEARLAQGIARGDALEEIAAELGIKMTTARTQLSAIFAKTGTRRQAKLVAILTRLALLVG